MYIPFKNCNVTVSEMAVGHSHFFCGKGVRLDSSFTLPKVSFLEDALKLDLNCINFLSHFLSLINLGLVVFVLNVFNKYNNLLNLCAFISA